MLQSTVDSRQSTVSAVDTRNRVVERLSRERFDLVVIGGGITGVGIARDAALRGLSVALIEKGDFASGTSSKSSKLIHGGLRYLEHAEFRLVFEGTNERALLMRVAPHLVRPLEFLLPVYKCDRPGLRTLDFGLWLYDALSKFSSPRLHRMLKRDKLLAIEPGLMREDLRGGLLYYDCMTDDARLVIENLIDAISLGAACVNRVRATGLVHENGQVVAVEAADESGEDTQRLTIRGKVVINATGPWCDEIRRMGGEPQVLHASKGVHLVVDSARLKPEHALVMKHGKRIIFIIPWGDRTVVGTTDTFYADRPEVVAADAGDIAYLLGLANRYFPEAKLGFDDVLATWAGVRPLLRPEGDVATASDVSREHKLYESPGLISIAGGKLTTYRRMAAEVVERAGLQLPAIPPGATEDRPLPGAVGLWARGLANIAEAIRTRADLDEAVAKHLADTYGSRATLIADRVKRNAMLRLRLDAELPFILAEVDSAVEDELALTVDDVLSRRMPLLLRARDQGLSAAPKVAARMAKLLGWTEDKTRREIAAYEAVVATTRAFRPR